MHTKSPNEGLHSLAITLICYMALFTARVAVVMVEGARRFRCCAVSSFSSCFGLPAVLQTPSPWVVVVVAANGHTALRFAKRGLQWVHYPSSFACARRTTSTTASTTAGAIASASCAVAILSSVAAADTSWWALAVGSMLAP